MKVNLLALAVIVLGTNLLLASPGRGQSASSVFITLECKKATLRNVFSKIEKLTDFRFAYKKEHVERYRSINLAKETRTLEQTLNLVLDNTDLGYKLVNNNIILFVKEDSNARSEETSRGAQVVVVDGTVRGKVSNTKGDIISGATVSLPQANRIVAADDKGEFVIPNVRSGSYILRVTAVGYLDYSREITVGNEAVNLIVTLTEFNQELDEVQVTALGIQRQSRTLTYATQKIDGEKLNEVRDGNIANTLNGKIAGLVVSQGAQGPGSAARILLRGNRSIGGNNSALIVVDGVIINNSAAGENGAWTGADGISNINPDDVDEINVLKGSAATALYGTTGANGVILISTKKGKAGRVSLDLNSGVARESAMLLPELQNEYGQGNGGVFGANAAGSWGPKINGQMVTDWTGKEVKLTAQPDNVKDFFKRGINVNNSIGISGGTEKIQTYFSYGNNYIEGLVPQNKLNRHTVNLRITTQISKRFSTDAKVTYVRQDIFDKPAVVNAASAAMNIYKIPRTVRLEDVRNYETINNLGIATPNYWFSSSSFGNPYWTVYNTHRNEKRNRIIGMISAKFKITDWLDIQGRASLDQINDKVSNVYDNNTVNFGRNGGSFSQGFADVSERNFDVIISGRNNISRDLKINYNAGAVLLDSRGESVNNFVEGLAVPNRFNLSFARVLTANNTYIQTQRQAIFATTQLSLKDFLYLDLSARQEYFSTLPPPYYSFYPSIGLSAVLSDMIKMPDAIDYSKLRVGFAKTGGGGPAFLTKQTYHILPGGYAGYIGRDPTSPFPDLKPELTTALEFGTEWRFLNNRLGIDITYYKSNTINQLVTIPTPPATGFASQYINVGDIRNSGIEVMLNATPVRSQHLMWDVNFNFAKNNNKVLELTPELKEVSLGIPVVDFSVPVVRVDGSYGDLYAYGWKRNDAGEFIVDETGRPVRTEELIKVGNFNPDFTMGLTNTFNYRNFVLNFLIDGRFGGEMTSATDATLGADGTAAYTTSFREEGSWVLPAVTEDGGKNNVPINAETFWNTVSGGRNAWGELFTYDATNVRLRELSLGYKFQRMPVSFLQSAKLSIVARNVFFFYRGSSIMDVPGVGKRKANFDSEVSLFVSNNQGLEYGTLPPTRSIGLNLKLSF